MNKFVENKARAVGLPLKYACPSLIHRVNMITANKLCESSVYMNMLTLTYDGVFTAFAD